MAAHVVNLHLTLELMQALVKTVSVGLTEPHAMLSTAAAQIRLPVTPQRQTIKTACYPSAWRSSSISETVLCIYHSVSTINMHFRTGRKQGREEAANSYPTMDALEAALNSYAFNIQGSSYTEPRLPSLGPPLHRKSRVRSTSANKDRARQSRPLVD